MYLIYYIILYIMIKFFNLYGGFDGYKPQVTIALRL